MPVRATPVRETTDHLIYLVSGASSHCLSLTHSANAATGVLVGQPRGRQRLASVTKTLLALLRRPWCLLALSARASPRTALGFVSDS